MTLAQRGITFIPAKPFPATVVFNGQNGWSVFNKSGLVLSPTTLTMPLSFQALRASALCKPVMAGGIIPFGLKRLAASNPTCLSQAWLNEISLDVSA